MWPLSRMELYRRVSRCNWDKPCKTPMVRPSAGLISRRIQFRSSLHLSFPFFLHHVCSSTSMTYLLNIASLPTIFLSNKRPCHHHHHHPYSYSFTLKALR